MDKFANVYWTVEDILSVYPDLTNEQCIEFLERMEEKIMEAMVQAGWEIIENN